VALVEWDLLERVLVALVEEEKVTVGEQLVDELVEDPWPCLDGFRGSEPVDLVEDAGAEPMKAQVQFEEDVVGCVNSVRSPERLVSA
jgi:hypothetical protein